MLIWFIGLSGSGKSYYSSLLVKKLREDNKNVLHLDGDEFREIFNNKDYSIEGRYKNAEKISKFSKFLSDQNIIVVGSVLSIFPQWQKWNRENNKKYFQIYIQSDIKNLTKRDVKGIYKNSNNNIVGIDIEFPNPYKSDYIFFNSFEKENDLKIIEEIHNRIIDDL